MTTDYERGRIAGINESVGRMALCLNDDMPADVAVGVEQCIRVVTALLPPAASGAGGEMKRQCEHKRIAGGSDCQYCLDCGQKFQPAWRRTGPQGETNLPPMPDPAPAAAVADAFRAEIEGVIPRIGLGGDFTRDAKVALFNRLWRIIDPDRANAALAADAQKGGAK